MTDHPDTEQLMALEEATQWEASHVLSHIASCAECHATIGGLEAFATLRAVAEPDTDFTRRVSLSIGSRPAVRVRIAIDRISLAVFASGSVIAWLAIAFASFTRTGAQTPGAGALLFAAIAGLAAVWFTNSSFTNTLTHRINAT